MEEILRFAGSYWWLIFIVGPVVGGWIGGVAKYNERRRRDRIELERIRRAPMQPVAGMPQQQPEADAAERAADRDRQIER